MTFWKKTEKLRPSPSWESAKWPIGLLIQTTVFASFAITIYDLTTADNLYRYSSLTLTISHYTVINMLCIFVYGSLGREDGCRCDRNT